MKNLLLQETGTVIYDISTKEYFAGLNTWSKQPRHAKVYKRQQYINDILQKYSDRTLKTATINVSVTLNKTGVNQND